VSVGKPCVHGRQTCFGAESQHEETRGQSRHARIKTGGCCDQVGPVQTDVTTPGDMGRGEEDEDRAEEREPHSDGADDDVFPRRFERIPGAVMTDQERGDDGGRLDGGPHDPDVVGEYRENHGG